LQAMACAWLMYFDRVPVSFCFCLDCGDTRHIIANHYAEHVQRYSTGSVLYLHVFRDAVESPAIRSVNIGAGDSGYKTRWGARPSFQLIDWIAFRPGAGGRLLELANRLR
jgi:CelD/BcsL family acetyltransferase involved in cellulose biosynthesis